jgi:hypothetical protein
MTPRTDWTESVDPGEHARYEEYGRIITAMQRRHAEDGHVNRGLHAKQHVGARATVTVLPDLPAHARVGIFATPGTYDAWVRFSNGAPTRAADHRPDVRGFAVKVLGVPGEKLIAGQKDATTQDFSMIQAPTVGFGNSERFMYFTAGAERPLTLLPRVFVKFGFRDAFTILREFARVTRRRVPSLASLRYWSAVPIRFGDYAVKYTAIPTAPAAAAVEPGDSSTRLADEMKARLAMGPVTFDFAVQFYCDPDKTPIEDASVEWLEADAPPVTVARITLPVQDLMGDAGRKQCAYVDSLSFDPWHAPVEFRPLGDIMRARGHVYRLSTAARKAAAEPTSLVRFE